MKKFTSYICMLIITSVIHADAQEKVIVKKDDSKIFIRQELTDKTQPGLALLKDTFIFMKQIIKTNDAPAPIGPYNQAVRAGNTLYISGQVAIDPATNQLITVNIIKETNQVMVNLMNILKAAGLDFSNVVKTTIFLKDMNDFATVNQVYGEYFKSDFPARETVEVARLPKDVHVEISMIAVQ